MKILAVAGSCRDGNTKHLVDSIIKNIFTSSSNADIEIKKIHLKDFNINFCSGCLECDTTGECVYNDDMSSVIPFVRDCDALILATPARWGLLSGEMKTFLDRLNPLAVKEELRNKRAIVISVGQSDEKEAESIKYAAESLVTFCENAGIHVVETVIVCGCYDASDVTSKTNYINSCKSAFNKLIDE